MHTKEDIFWGKQKERGVVLNEVQQQAVVNTDGALLLLASPGSGKTTTVIMKIAYLLEVKGWIVNTKSDSFFKVCNFVLKWA